MSGETRFERVVLPHLNAAYTLARYLTKDVNEAEDATQEAILRAVRYVHTLRNDADARAWLLAIVRRECYGGRQHRIDTVAFDDVPELQLVDQGAQTDAAANRSMLQHRIREVVAALPDGLRETLILRELQQCSYDEIATITEVPLGTVMSRLSRARARVAEALGSLASFEEGYG
ncbi:MAG: polymerase subunit sigma [Gemmatimonadetes bacterium]|nr:polymerase subunit sigma [Gemmatimonadota bacterium]